MHLSHITTSYLNINITTGDFVVFKTITHVKEILKEEFKGPPNTFPVRGTQFESQLRKTQKRECLVQESFS